ncbi:tubulin-like doman-containing protein [Parafrankia elaeagni]|uniref:tubulin-like doman-containing protein n=1 Tax=Parafrankia elaeagni TaxID=222534 RepID=UPI0003780AD8|nr:tubulin-like doman-containing protein [Parafrankia elaeagni]
MNIYQPMLFVGLGGTGCLIGAELERRLRGELCGPDGRALNLRVPGKNYLPYQLPSCLQFVYADLSENELTRLRTRVVPSEDHVNAAAATQHVTHGLIPTIDNYPDLARSLRVNAREHVRPWLPPSEGEPLVAPLILGAGQLPTIGRAALFETFRSGVAPAREPVAQAVGQIATSGQELAALGGKLGQTCDVFVAFSVAGGTGAGIFYDYLHLIGDAFQQAKVRAKIYPLVLMPSAFDEGLGGGRPARLNAGRALLDLFRLVDDQNGRPAGTNLTMHGTSGTLGVRYPDGGRSINLMTSTVKTGFLFSRAGGVQRDDLHRSIVSLVLSLVGTGLENSGGSTATETFQSFADSFINSDAERGSPASSGIGRRGVSTSLVASMTIPAEDLADLVAARLLARGVDDLSSSTPGSSADDAALIRRFAFAANIGPILSRQPPGITESSAERGAGAILAALQARLQAMQGSLTSLHASVSRQVPEIAAAFDPGAGLDDLLGVVDLLHARRIVEGQPTAAEQVSRDGVVGFLANRRSEPRPPAGLTLNPPVPAPGSVRDHRLGSRARWGDPAVQQIIGAQDAWYNWRTRTVWNSAWDEHQRRWERPITRLRAQLRLVADAFAEHSRAEPGEFARRAADLYRARTGVTNLLPPHGDMDNFYQQALGRLVAAQGLGGAASEGQVVHRVLGPDGWRRVWQALIERGGDAAVAVARDRLKEEVKRLFQESSGIAGEPLLPTMASLLAEVVRRDGPPAVGDDDLRQFEAKIHGLVPATFSPQGSGKLKILVSYPAGARDPQIEKYLNRSLRLPTEPGISMEFRPINAESIVVVLLRSSMSVTQVPELRQILHHWAGALRNEQREDFLRWRQRLGYDYGWLATTEHDRVAILHRLLCAMWNGQVQVLDGKAGSPYAIRVVLGDSGGDADELGGYGGGGYGGGYGGTGYGGSSRQHARDTRDEVDMTLALSPFEPASSWGSLLRAYEDWSFADDEVVRDDFCRELMKAQPDGLNSQVVEPDPVFRAFVDSVGEQARLLADMLGGLPAGSRSWAEQQHDFWARTVPAALEMPFANVSTPARRDLRELYRMVNDRPVDFTK